MTNDGCDLPYDRDCVCDHVWRFPCDGANACRNVCDCDRGRENEIGDGREYGPPRVYDRGCGGRCGCVCGRAGGHAGGLSCVDVHVVLRMIMLIVIMFDTLCCLL